MWIQALDAFGTVNTGITARRSAANDNSAAPRDRDLDLRVAAALGTPWLGAADTYPAPAKPGLSAGAQAAGLTFHAHARFADVAAEWKTLQRDAVAFPFQTVEWLSAWHQDVGRPRGIEPFLVLGRDAAGAVKIIFPLGIERGMLTTRLVWLGHPTCDYNAPMVCPRTLDGISVEDAHAMWRAILSLAPDVDYAYLTKQPAVIGAAENPFHHVAAHASSAGAYAATLDTTWDAFYRSRRSGKARNKNARMEKRLAAMGDLRFDCVEDPGERSALAAWVLDLKHRQLERTGARTPFGADDIRRFFDRVTSNEELKLFRLTLDGEPLAAVLGLVRDGCFYYVVPVYDFGAHARCSPGNTLLHKVMEWSIERGLTRFDFTIGDEAYKRDWSDIVVPMSFTCLPATLKGWLASRIVTHAMAAKKRLKRNAYALKTASSVVRLLQPRR